MKKTKTASAKKVTKEAGKIDKLIAQKIEARAFFQAGGFGGKMQNPGNKNFGAKQKKGSRGDR
jgi:hypothetical protein